MSLAVYLKSPYATRVRELLTTRKAIFDLSLAAAKEEYHLEVYSPNVDKDGFDLIVDDSNSTLRKFQLKSKLDSKTKSWTIDRILMRPSIYVCEKLGFEPTVNGVGMEGGVILIDVKIIDDNLSLDYYYSDIFIMTAMKLGVISKFKNKIDSNARRVLARLEAEVAGKIKIPLGCFVKAKNASGLLVLLGFYSASGDSQWRDNLSILSEATHRRCDEIKFNRRLMATEIHSVLSKHIVGSWHCIVS